MIPFTLQEFIDLVAGYNFTFRSLLVLANALAVLTLALTFLRIRHAGRFITALLVTFWLWAGIVFNGIYFSRLTPIALIVTALFVLQALFLISKGLLQEELSFTFKLDRFGILGGTAILYALVGYPLIGFLSGRDTLGWLMIGLTPCPTAVFTLGLFLWTEKPLPKEVLPIPILYALSGWVPASLGIIEDYGLVLIGLLVGALILFTDRMNFQILHLQRNRSSGPVADT